MATRTAAEPALRPDYGLDAPGVVRNLALGAAAGFAIWLSAATGLWSGAVRGISLSWMAAGCAMGLGVTAVAMLYSSKIGKRRSRERLLDLIAWRGDEAVLDIGCGRGLMLIGAARRVPHGRAVGIDLWQTEDLAGNRPDATLENARREGVADRVEVKTADMRELPFTDGSFDAVVSNWAVHNIYDQTGREKAVAEIARVLKPGGTTVLSDIRHIGEYAAAFSKNGCDARRASPWWKAPLLAAVTLGSLRPGVVVATKRSTPA